MTKRFPAKILLFGEHTILRGSRALAIPYPQRYAQWVQREETYEHRSSLLSFIDYLAQELNDCFEVERARAELATGWQLTSNIPTGYGAGSSGAVCVAIFSRYATQLGRERCQADEKGFWAKMEGFFHGTSSGTDPLIIAQNAPILLQASGQYAKVELPPIVPPYHLFLLDTRQTRSTAPLVAFFTEQYDNNRVFRKAVENSWIPANESAIDALLTGQLPALAAAFRTISAFQLEHLPPMVLPKLRNIWEHGLEHDLYQLKICGAGGGGFCLGLSKDWVATEAALASWGLEKVV